MYVRIDDDGEMDNTSKTHANDCGRFVCRHTRLTALERHKLLTFHRPIKGSVAMFSGEGLFASSHLPAERGLPTVLSFSPTISLD